MDPDFWRARWRERKIGFHQEAPNAWLSTYWSKLRLAGTETVFVPLAGKTLDLHWLRSQGHGVLGIELSDIAVREFFDEAGWQPQRHHEGRFDVYEAEGVRLLCGDFFELQVSDLLDVGAVYDRAALIALPTATRAAYARHLIATLPARAPMFLITLEYDGAPDAGPPFSVTEAEVRALYEPAFEVTTVHRTDAQPALPGLQARGVESMREAVSILRRR